MWALVGSPGPTRPPHGELGEEGKGREISLAGRSETYDKQLG